MKKRMSNSELLKTTLKWNKIHDPRTGQFSSASRGGAIITTRKRVPGGVGRSPSARTSNTAEEKEQVARNIAKAAVMPLSQFMQSSYVGPKNERLNAMIADMPVGTTVSGWTKIQGKSGAYWKKGASTALALPTSVSGSSVHKAIISNAVKNGSLSAKNAVKIHSASYNNIASWAELKKILAMKEIGTISTYKAVAFVSPKKFTPKRKVLNQGKGFAGTKKIPRPEYGDATNYSLTGEPTPPPRMYVLNEVDMLNKLSDAERDRVKKMTGNTVVAAGSKWKKDSKNGTTIFQRVMQVFDNMKDYTKPERPFFSNIKKYTHRNPVTKKEGKGNSNGDADRKGEYDAEGEMAKSQLQSLIRNSKLIHDGLKDDTNIAEWVQSKISIAEDYISTAANYMQNEYDKTTTKAKKAPPEGSKISEAVRNSLKTKVKEHNKKYGEIQSKRVTLSMLARVFRRGVGAYQTNRGSVRPGVTGPDQWAHARVNTFLAAVRTGRYKSGSFDTDLLPKKHPLSSRKSLKERTRDYREEYDHYHKRPEQRARRVLRNQARKKMGLKVGDPREVDHKQPLSKNGGNGNHNLRAISFQKNRSKGSKTVKELVSLAFKSRGVDTSLNAYDIIDFLAGNS